MKAKAGTIVVAVIVTAALMSAERESPGATGRGAAELRGAVTPAAAEVLGAAGDAVLSARQEAQRQGLNPGALLSTPTTQAQGLPDIDPDRVTR